MTPVAVIALLCAAVVIADNSSGTKQDARQQSAPERELAGEMVPIPGGTFRMGDLSGEGYGDERPVRSVTVPAFRLGEHEVTFAQWDACVADGGCNGYSPDDLGWGRGNQPVIYVSWDDAHSFIRWLNSKTDGNYRLPTDAEWEYAARAGTTTEYSVYEWVQDCWNDNYEGAPTDGSAWTSGDCIERVIRDGPRGTYLGSIDRYRDGRSGRNEYTGFRLAQDE